MVGGITFSGQSGIYAEGGVNSTFLDGPEGNFNLEHELVHYLRKNVGDDQLAKDLGIEGDVGNGDDPEMGPALQYCNLRTDETKDDSALARKPSIELQDGLYHIITGPMSMQRMKRTQNTQNNSKQRGSGMAYCHSVLLAGGALTK